jgi:uncharacterized spore protein YtfJ
MDNNLNNSLETLFSKMDDFVSTKTVVGEPVNIGGTIMLPLVDVIFGVAAGAVNGSEKDKKNSDMGGLGAKITPSAVIVIKDNTVQLVNVKNQDAVSKLIDMAPGIVSKFNLGSIFTPRDKENLKDDGKKSENEPEERIIKETIVREIEE